MSHTPNILQPSELLAMLSPSSAGAGGEAAAGGGEPAGEAAAGKAAAAGAAGAGAGKAGKVPKVVPYVCSVLLIAKGEQPYIREFVHYYRMIGMDHIFIYDNADADELTLAEVLTDKEREFCTIVPFPGKAQQKNAYCHFIDNLSHLTDWVLVVDGDEFLVLHQHRSITEFIQQKCRRVFGVGINWYMFGFGNQKVWPRGNLVLESYTRGSPNHHIKTLARTAILRTLKAKRKGKLDCIHNLFGICQQLDGQLIRGPWLHSRPDAGCVSIYHYWSKSVEEFEAKLQRGRATLNARRNRGEAFAHAAEIQKETNTYMVDRVVPLFYKYLEANGITKEHLTELHHH